MTDLSIVVDGMRFPNPFVLGSGPPGTNGKVIKRSFELGFVVDLDQHVEPDFDGQLVEGRQLGVELLHTVLEPGPLQGDPEVTDADLEEPRAGPTRPGTSLGTRRRRGRLEGWGRRE